MRFTDRNRGEAIDALYLTLRDLGGWHQTGDVWTACVKFGVLRPNRRQVAASHPSALIGWNVSLAPCAHLGMVIKEALSDAA